MIQLLLPELHSSFKVPHLFSIFYLGWMDGLRLAKKGEKFGSAGVNFGAVSEPPQPQCQYV